MKLLVICVFYPPLNSSAAIQINHLVEELASQGNIIEVITPDSATKKDVVIERKRNIKIMRFSNGKITDTSLFKRALNEFIMPFRIIFNIIKNSVKIQKNDGIICWSPSIFFTPLIIYLKLKNNCKCYLILRDIFPKWAKDLKIIKNQIIYHIFNLFFLSQCYFADIIGVQSEGNKKFIPKQIFFKKNKIDVLYNWYKPSFKNINSKIKLSNTILKNKKVFIHAGNIGLAQGFEIFINLAADLQKNDDIGFLFIGRGSEFESMKSIAKKRGIINILFHEEIDNSQIMDLYDQCSYGLVILDRRHKTHNIPGKFLSYLHAGLPIFALVNEDNDLISMINKNNLGFASCNFDTNFLKKELINISNKINSEKIFKEKNKRFAKDLFSVKKASIQIISELNKIRKY